MGLNSNVFVIKKAPSRESLFEHLKLIELDPKQADFESVLGLLWEQRTEKLISVSQFNDMCIIVDDSHYTEDKLIEYSFAFKTELLQAENSDTTETCSFSFYKDGKLIRKVSLGMEQWIDEMKEIEMDEIEKEAMLSAMSEETAEIGEELEIEKNGSDALSVLKTYALDYFDFYKLSWTLYKVGV